jgi:hypothetical protein
MNTFLKRWWKTIFCTIGMVIILTLHAVSEFSSPSSRDRVCVSHLWASAGFCNCFYSRRQQKWRSDKDKQTFYGMHPILGTYCQNTPASFSLFKLIIPKHDDTSLANPSRRNYYTKFFLHLARQWFCSTRSESLGLSYSPAFLHLPLYPDGLSHNLLWHTCALPFLLAPFFLRGEVKR